jgi:benzoyl-CoA-dihydrodiol lyase
LDRKSRIGTLVIRGPEGAQPESVPAVREAGADWWPLRVFREIDHSLLHLRFNEPEIGLLILKSQGDLDAVRRVDDIFARFSQDWFIHETLLLMKRTLKRLDLTSRSIFALIEPGSCFAGSLLELALAADRSYMLDSPDRNVQVATSSLNSGLLPMSNGLSRLQCRFPGQPSPVEAIVAARNPFSAREAEEAGLVTLAIDDIDYADDVRVAIEERASISPDALTAMEACLRFAGPETMETRIFGRLSAWQNWVFSRPNAIGEKGALTLYGKPSRPVFDWTRT